MKTAAAGKILMAAMGSTDETCWFSILLERLERLQPHLRELQAHGKSAFNVTIADNHLVEITEVAPRVSLWFPPSLNLNAGAGNELEVVFLLLP